MNYQGIKGTKYLSDYLMIAFSDENRLYMIFFKTNQIVIETQFTL